MSEIGIVATAGRIARLYEESDAAERRAYEAHHAQEIASTQISAALDALTRVVPRMPEEILITAVVLGGKLAGNEINGDANLSTEAERTVRNLICGLASQLKPEAIAALPLWVRQDLSIFQPDAGGPGSDFRRHEAT